MSRVRWTAGLVFSLAGGLLSASAFGQAAHPGGKGPAQAHAEQMSVIWNGHPHAMMVAGADSAEALAGDLEVPGAFVPLRLTVHNRVLVQSDRVQDVRTILHKQPGFFLQANPPQATTAQWLDGWVVVETRDVRSALQVADFLNATGQFKSVTVDVEQPRKNLSLPNDPLVSNQWHLQNNLDPDADMNVSSVYAQGITGAGVTVGILDAGDDSFQPNHPDLRAHYDSSVSMTTTRFPTDASQQHPTEVAGVIGAVGNNGIGVAGVAYNSMLARLANGGALVQSQALQWYYNSIDVKNNSWGFTNPPGFIMAHPYMTPVKNAIERSTLVGRFGKGGVFVFSAGNGAGDGFAITAVEGTMGDRCDYMPLAADRRTIAVGAVGEDNIIASYSSTGTSVFCSAYSEGDTGRAIETTTSGSDYTNGFNGTSASAPMVAGMVALMLEANPSLSWHDVQLIIKATSRQLNLDGTLPYFPPLTLDPANATFWQVNGALTAHSDEYGFGLVDAEAAVNMARSFTPKPEPELYDSLTVPEGDSIPDAAWVETEEGSNEFNLVPGDEIRFPFCVRPNASLESIEVTINTTGGRRGDLLILLYSPWGSFSPLALPRPDYGTTTFPADYNDYTFTTFKHWDEGAGGVWEIGVSDFIPDDIPEFEDPDSDPAPPDPVVNADPFFFQSPDPDLIPGLATGEQTVVDIRLQLYGQPPNPDDYYLCDPFGQSCPDDINGDQIVDVSDLILFLQYYYAHDPFADLNGDGYVSYGDLAVFMSLFDPGVCSGPGDGVVGQNGRPMPGDQTGHPIGPGPGGT